MAPEKPTPRNPRKLKKFSFKTLLLFHNLLHQKSVAPNLKRIELPVCHMQEISFLQILKVLKMFEVDTFKVAPLKMAPFFCNCGLNF